MGYASAGVNIDDILAKDPLFKWDVQQNTFLAIAGTWTKELSAANYDIGSVCTNMAVAPGVNDKLGLGCVFIPKDGTYEVRLIGITGTNYGNVHVLLKGVDKATIDMYATPIAYNVPKTVTLGALIRGLYTVSLIISDKNASSSDYLSAFQTISINKTA